MHLSLLHPGCTAAAGSGLAPEDSISCGAQWTSGAGLLGSSRAFRWGFLDDEEDASEPGPDRRLQRRFRPSGPLEQLLPSLPDELVQTTEGSNTMQGMAWDCQKTPSQLQPPDEMELELNNTAHWQSC